LLKRPLLNNEIRADKVRLIDDAENQIGVVPLQDALQMARERNLDLIQVTEKVEPPVCKLMDYGKYLYWLQKKEKAAGAGKRSGQVKGIRLTFNISPHDMETRAKIAEKFLKEGNRIRIEMVLRGREKGMANFATGKISQFLEILEKIVPIKIERELKREMKGFSMLISKG
jgi:translation initiation factor IF-3